MSKQLDSLYQNIRSLVLEARKRTYHIVKSAMTQTYWEVGRMIIEEEQDGKDRAAYGKQILKFLSERLTADFGEGFDQSNLRYMRRVFNAFPIRDALRHELTWTHYRLLSKVDNERARLFYRENKSVFIVKYQTPQYIALSKERENNKVANLILQTFDSQFIVP